MTPVEHAKEYIAQIERRIGKLTEEREEARRQRNEMRVRSDSWREAFEAKEAEVRKLQAALENAHNQHASVMDVFVSENNELRAALRKARDVIIENSPLASAPAHRAYEALKATDAVLREKHRV